MFQSAIFANLQVNNFGIPTVRFATTTPLLRWAKSSFDGLVDYIADAREAADLQRLGTQTRRDIGFLG